MLIDEYQLIPKEAFLFFPKDEEIVQFRNKKEPTKPYRIIFEGVSYNSYEK